MLGAAVGSFLNVVISRTQAQESWVFGRSHCDACRKQIKWYDNIPVFSYVVLRAKCRYCREPIALTHPVVEILVGSLFVWWYISGAVFFTLTQHPFVVLQPLFWLLVGVLLIAIMISDFRYKLIPELLVVLLTILTIIYRLALVTSGIMQVRDLQLALLGMVISVMSIWLLWFFSRGRAMGFGDVELMVPLSLLVGWPNVFVALYLSFMLGGLVGVGLVLTKKKKMNHQIAFGPFLILGTFISLVWGDPILSWYISLL
jgi:leader peptidase (prepilin peptidase)/N-methyltransferase